MLVLAEDAYAQPRPSIKSYVENLEHTWGNSKDWVLELRGGRQIVIPLSLYLSLGSMLDFLDLEGAEGQGNHTCKEEGHTVSWADECDGALDNVFAV